MLPSFRKSVILSPTDKALDAVLGAAKKADAELPKEHAAMMARADIAGCLNMRIAGPIYVRMLKQFQEMMPGNRMPRTSSP